ncbi:hypothetical protein ABZ896_22785 [Streptomyces sp. NPDC047072]|uniref:hypothetical protein n=1 Tax=Streptomyces sp. NPDC047072 TaxID=3154809 RepID=UPI0033FD8A01
MFALLRRFAKAVAPSDSKVSEPEPLCPETGLPYGEPHSTERLAWIFAMHDLEDARERALSSGIAS